MLIFRNEIWVYAIIRAISHLEEDLTVRLKKSDKRMIIG